MREFLRYMGSRGFKDPLKIRSVTIKAGLAKINGDLAIPPKARGIVLFAHGSGSGRFSPRNRFVADYLQKAGLATFLIDLLTREEEGVDELTGQFRFNIELLSGRLIWATNWLSQDPKAHRLRVGYFGASTGAAAALVAVAGLGDLIRAIVSRGGRPDLAKDALDEVKAPVLLIVGGNDPQVLDLNKKAISDLTSATNKELVIIPGATHLFEEPGALEEVARLSSEWFLEYLGR